MTGRSDHRYTTAQPPLPTWLDRYTTLGLYGLLVGTGLCLAAFVTNPVPDPSFPWATLPAPLRLPFEQPRIEHWPTTYTLGIWLWILGFPALFLDGYRRFGTRTTGGSTMWLAGLPTVAMLGWTTYCRFFWPKLHPPTWNAPSYTVVCWLYCSSYDVLWSNTAYAIALFGIVATLLALRRKSGDGYALLGFGLLALPLGLPAVYAGYHRMR
ncbi:hypothetical protein SAMN06269185_1722 [Natronoarchaeum philippinense]|uniref:Uncharacterized protein n=1 Tax=Natronoarchaeum philippinense TaxID=558529 RepID=A0A285NX08_NATPI|nr:hypothetical protein [Natronoarchaeum philippinense]SNZ12426.1 hypothetical protein SAMN06269185_1722 [Natronoarchaeum philippinense]